MKLWRQYHFINVLNNLFSYNVTKLNFCNKCSISNFQTVEDAIHFWKNEFEKKNISEANTSIELIMSYVLNIEKVRIFIKSKNNNLLLHL